MTNCEKEQALKNFFSQKKNVLIAFSGGVDSSLLTAFAAEAPIKATAVTLKTELMSEKEIENAVQTAKEIGINHIVLEKSVLGIPEIGENRQNRCYVCKKEIFQTLLKFAEENGFETVLEGTNYSDIENREKQNDLRPGFSALLELNEIQKQKEEKQKDEQNEQKKTRKSGRFCAEN
jgi:ATP-utilizing enzymes of the PP-loop superfamily